MRVRTIGSVVVHISAILFSVGVLVNLQYLLFNEETLITFIFIYILITKNWSAFVN